MRSASPFRATALSILLALSPALLSCGKKKPAGGGATDSKAAGDALFIVTAPAVIPPELAPDFAAMKVGRLYLAGATLAASGKVTPLPPPPDHVSQPVSFVLMGEEGASGLFATGEGQGVGERLGAALTQPLEEAKSWGTVTGIHIHVIPQAAQLPTVAAAAKALKSKTGLPVSITLLAGTPPASIETLKGAVDEVLILTFGRRPETGDQLAPELSEAEAKAISVPFRLLLVPGGYGFAGSSPAPVTGRRMPDGEIDTLSEDRNLDFDFGQVLSTDPGTVYNFKPREGFPAYKTNLAQDGGYAQFRFLVIADLVRFLGASRKWGDTKLAGRVFLIEGLPRDPHLIHFGTLRTLLSGSVIDPVLNVSAAKSGSRGNEVSYVLTVTNDSVASTGLSRLSNFVRIRVEGGVVAGVSAGDFDRFEILESAAPNSRAATFGKATVVKLYENFFAPGEANQTGALRIAGSRPKVFLSYQLTLTDGRTVEGKELEVGLGAP